MLNKLRSRAEDEKGFTLIELLVVILIIGILAAIAIPAFLNQKGKAYDSNAKSDARTAATAEETYYTDNNVYSNLTSDMTSIEPTLNQATPAVAAGGEALTVNAPAQALYGATLVGTATASNSYDVNVTSKSGVKYAYIRQSDGTVSKTCDTSGAANASGCKIVSGTTGTW
ncbi:MAG TPA: prepilin-type N-terminal cleavage/methylation domain-containing protein [Solirubrobacteraceae bacterium]|nr:prepilin-type N-terminal cleavage/methylation domain-containing protein [Solirubrobacteraceae bacterium]